MRTLLAGGCEELADVSVVTFPAYPQTSAEARSMSAKFNNADPQAGEGEDESKARARLGVFWRKLELVELE